MLSARRLRLLSSPLLALALLGGEWGQSHAASPSLGGVSPRGAQRGTEIEVVFSGAQLDDAQEILFYEPGIEVTKLEAVNPTTLKAVSGLLREGDVVVVKGSKKMFWVNKFVPRLVTALQAKGVS